MYDVRLVVDEIEAIDQTDQDGFTFGFIPKTLRPGDEVYFVVSGASSNNQQFDTKIPEKGTQKIKENKPVSNIELQRFQLKDKEKVGLIVNVSEEDGPSVGDVFKSILPVLVGAGKITAAILTSNVGLGLSAAPDLKKGASDLYKTIDDTKNQSIGAFSLEIDHKYGKPEFNWISNTEAKTQLVFSNYNTAEFIATDNGDGDNNYKYRIRVRAELLDTAISALDYSLENTNDKNLILIGNDVIDGKGNDLNNRISGNNRSNILYGGGGDDYVNGREDNDTLYGWYGDDTLDGWSGNDDIFGEAGNDVLFGGDGNDLINGGKDNDTLSGYLGNDKVFGEAGNDLLRGGNGNDLIKGGEGNDTLFGGIGNDTLSGGFGYDIIDGQEGIDTVNYNYYNEGISLNLLAQEENSFTDENLNNKPVVNKWDAVTKLDVVTNIENAIGGQGDDTIFGSSINNEIKGGKGNDNINGKDGDDRLFGNEGNDIIYGGKGNDTITGGVQSGNLEQDTLVGNEGSDIFELSNSHSERYKNLLIRSNFNPHSFYGVSIHLLEITVPSFYFGKGDEDYALIEDFTKGEDKIRILGITSLGGDIIHSYSLRKVQGNANAINTNIYYNDDLIGIVSGADIELTQEYFTFV